MSTALPRPGGAAAGPIDRPAWLSLLAGRLAPAKAPPPDGAARAGRPAGRASAVLVLFGPGAGGADVLLLERAGTLRAHAGQVAFPGGAFDPGDRGPIATALREATEETGLASGQVEVLGVLPARLLAVSGYLVVPVVGWATHPTPPRVVDAAEVTGVCRVPVRDLVDPAHRFRVRHPSGRTGPAFRVPVPAGSAWVGHRPAELVVWGFTAGLLAHVLALAGLERAWDAGHLEDPPVPRGVPGGGAVATVRPMPQTSLGPRAAGGSQAAGGARPAGGELR